MSSPKNLRRSSRIQAISRKKYTEDSDENIDENPTKPNRIPILINEIEKQLESVEQDTRKPFELFSEKDVSGQKLYGFQTPVKKNSMMLKAKQCCTPTTPKSFQTLPVLKIVLENILTSPEGKKSFTKNINEKVFSATEKKSSIMNYATNAYLSTDESVSEDSEYLAHEDEGSSEIFENSESEDSSESSDMEEKENNRRRLKQRFAVEKSLLKCEGMPSTPVRTKRGRKPVAYKDYHIKTDEYFESQAEKAVTSDHTLGKLRNARLNEETLEKLLTNENHISKIHKKRICSLTENYRSFFSMWQFIMEEGYSLLLYGLGSKRNLINNFHSEIIADHPALIINGFFPSLSMKDILNNIIVDLMDLKCPPNPNDCLELIEKVLKENVNDRLYLIIHNIDGVMLRSHKAQNILASLAAIPNVRIIASVDHINAPLIWDNVKRAKFNFYWWDATTFLPYQAETSYESSLLVQRNSTLALSSLQNVFQSLTSNARAIYLILVRYQLNKSSSNNFTGMPFKDLYRAAREQFLVSSDLTLRAQLTEFIDHKLVRTKRMFDGAEHVSIPLEKGLLKYFMEQHEY